jgi:hypothetical protein
MSMPGMNAAMAEKDLDKLIEEMCGSNRGRPPHGFMKARQYSREVGTSYER